MAEFDELVGRLSRPHPVTVHKDDGPAYITVPGLIQQLRDELFGSSDTGAASGNKTKLPLNAPALDNYTLIDRQVAEVWAAAFNKPPGAERTERMLAEWAAYIDETTIITVSSPETIKVWSDKYRQDAETVIWTRAEVTALNLLRSWVRRIEDMFNPPRTAEITAACIQCGERSVWKVQDGQHMKSSALVFVRDRETGDTVEARCLNPECRASWTPDQFLYMAEKIAAAELAEDVAWWEASPQTADSLREFALRKRKKLADAIAHLTAGGCSVLFEVAKGNTLIEKIPLDS